MITITTYLDLGTGVLIKAGNFVLRLAVSRSSVTGTQFLNIRFFHLLHVPVTEPSRAPAPPPVRLPNSLT